MAGYIYIIQAPNRQCYVGQSTDTDVVDPEAANVPYKRIYQHVLNTYTRRKKAEEDASVPIFQCWPLKYLEIYVYTQAEDYGLEPSVYETFLRYFTHTGREKITGQGKIREVRKSKSGLKVVLENDQEYELTEGEKIDIAEIIWMARRERAGYKMLNKSMGGQHASWEFVGIGGNVQPVNITTTPPSVITSLLLSTEMSSEEQKVFKDFQKDLDALFEKYLTKDAGDAILDTIKARTNSAKNLLRGRGFDLKPILQEAIEETLKGNNKYSSNLKTELEALIEKYSTGGLIDFEYQIKQNKKDENENQLLKAISSKLAASLLGPFQKAKLYQNSEWNINFYYGDDGVISYKGKGGRNIGDGKNNHISVSLDQTFPSISKYNDKNKSWWYEPTHPGDKQVPIEIRWNWTRHVFDYHFQKVKVQDKKKSLVSKAKRGNFIVQDQYAIVGGEEKPETLSVKMMMAYREKLNFNNAILHNWRPFFSRLYAGKTKSIWDVELTSEGDFVAILSGQTIKTEGGALTIGMYIEDQDTFDTDREDAPKDIIF